MSLPSDCQCNSSNLGEEQGSASLLRIHGTDRACLRERMPPPTNEAIREISPRSIYLCQPYKPRLLFLSALPTNLHSCLPPWIHRNPKKNTKGVFLNRDCWDSTQKNECWLKRARTAHRGTMQWEYSPPQMSLAKTSHMVLANSKEAGKYSSPGCPGRREPDTGSTHVYLKPLSSWSFQWPGEEKEINVLEYFKYRILPFHFSVSFASACNTS